MGLAAALAVGALSGATGLPASAGVDHSPGHGRAQLQADVDAIRATGAVGVQALATQQRGRGGSRGRSMTAVSGVGDLGTGELVPTNGHYRIGSNTKTFVATVVLQLEAEGRLSLGDTVEEHLPGVVRGHGHDGRRVTIRQLLQHTSGIADHTEGPGMDVVLSSPASFDEHRDDHFEPEELVAMAMRMEREFEPGTSWSYSNTNYVLAGMIIEEVTGHSWHDEVTDRIVEPLGLDDTTAGDGIHVPAPRAHGYHQFVPAGLHDVTDFDPSWGGAAGDMISTPRDMNRFFRALLGGRLLPRAQLAEMQHTVPAVEFQDEVTPNYRYGLGLAWNSLTCGGGYWSHGGDIPGFQSREGFAEHGGRGVVLSVSTTRGDPDDGWAQDMANHRLIDHALCGRP